MEPADPRYDNEYGAFHAGRVDRSGDGQDDQGVEGVMIMVSRQDEGRGGSGFKKM